MRCNRIYLRLLSSIVGCAIIILQACSAYRPIETPINSATSFNEVYLVYHQEKYRLYNMVDNEYEISADAYPISLKDTTQKHNNLLIYSHQIILIEAHANFNEIQIPKNSIYKCRALVYDEQYRRNTIINSVVFISIGAIIVYALLQDIPRDF